MLVGTLLMFIGVVAYVSSRWDTLPIFVRVVLLYALGGGLLGLGRWLEPKKAFVIIGRSLLGCGWAVVFFTTYALHHAETTHLIDSLAVDMVLMLIVAAAMIRHSLRYDSQLTTGFAFLLGFYAIGANHGTGSESAAGLLAGPVLAGGMIYLTLRRNWFELDVFGILAAYVTHFLWLLPLVKQDAAGHVQHFAGYEYSVAALITYWVLYRASYLMRTVHDANEENVSTISALLNSFCFLGLMKYQSVHPELAFYALLVLGTVELALGQFAKSRNRRMAFLVLSTLGICLLVAAVPFKLAAHPGRMAIVWLAGAQAFFFIGILANEVLFRRMGKLVSLLAAGTLIFKTGFDNLPRIFEHETMTADETSLLRRVGIVFVIAGLTLWMNAHAVRRRWPALFEYAFDINALLALSWSGLVCASVGVAFFTPDTWIPVSLAALAAAIAFAGRRLKDQQLLVQSVVLCLATIIELFSGHPGFQARWHGVSFELLIGFAVAAFFYSAARSQRMAEETVGSHASPIVTWVTALLLAVVLYHGLPEAWVGPGWAAFALCLAAAANLIQQSDSARKNLLLQAHALGLLAFVRALFVNLSEPYRHQPIQLSTVLISAAALYALVRISKIYELDEHEVLPKAHSWFASTLVTWLMWHWLQPVAVAVGWALFGLLIFEIGILRKGAYLRWQGYVALACGFIRIYFANIGAQGEAGAISPIIYTILPIAAIFYYVYWRLDESGDAISDKEQKFHLDAVLSIAGTVALGTIIRFEARPHWVVAGWAALVFGLFAFAWLSGRENFRYQALLGLAPVAFRFAMYNLYERGGLTASFLQDSMVEFLSILLLLASLPIAYKLRDRDASPGNRWVRWAMRPEQFFFFTAVALATALLFRRLDGGWITLAWAVEAIVIFSFALMVKERSFRLCGLAILVLCVLKIGFVDFWRMEKNERWLVSFGLGAIMILVGYLYSYNREKLRELL